MANATGAQLKAMELKSLVTFAIGKGLLQKAAMYARTAKITVTSLTRTN